MNLRQKISEKWENFYDPEELPDMWTDHTYKIYSFLAFLGGFVSLLASSIHDIFYFGAVLGLIASYWLSRKVEWEEDGGSEFQL